MVSPHGLGAAQPLLFEIPPIIRGSLPKGNPSVTFINVLRYRARFDAFKRRDWSLSCQ